jgi:biopolymer transport protein ExbD/biopolymer transport protein TolR
MGMGGGGEKGSINSEINVTPMADVMLVLLIIFMVITPMLQKGVSVEMAQTDNPRDMEEADAEDSILISVTRDSKYYLNAGEVQLPEIGPEVSALLEGKLDRVVFIKSDFRAVYGDVVSVVNEVRGSGVDRIGLLTERRDAIN